MDFETLLKIGEIPECSTDYLLRGEGKKNNPSPEDGNGRDPLDRRLNELLAQATAETKQAMIVLLEQSQKR